MLINGVKIMIKIKTIYLVVKDWLIAKAFKHENTKTLTYK